MTYEKISVTISKNVIFIVHIYNRGVKILKSDVKYVLVYP